jgi:hypothetical protein
MGWTNPWNPRESLTVQQVSAGENLDKPELKGRLPGCRSVLTFLSSWLAGVQESEEEQAPRRHATLTARVFVDSTLFHISVYVLYTERSQHSHFNLSTSFVCDPYDLLHVPKMLACISHFSVNWHCMLQKKITEIKSERKHDDPYEHTPHKNLPHHVIWSGVGC